MSGKEALVLTFGKSKVAPGLGERRPTFKAWPLGAWGLQAWGLEVWGLRAWGLEGAWEIWGLGIGLRIRCE